MSKFLVPFYVVGGGFGLLMTACVAAWIYEKTRKTLEHPRLGRLTFSSGLWTGLRHYIPAQPAVRFTLPGDKSGPDPMQVERFEQLWSALGETLERIRPHAMGEYNEIKDCDQDSELTTEISASLNESEKGFDKYWNLAEIGLQERPKGKFCWNLELEVAWDIEHSRAASLDLDGQVLNYGLSCALVVEE